MKKKIVENAILFLGITLTMSIPGMLMYQDDFLVFLGIAVGSLLGIIILGCIDVNK